MQPRQPSFGIIGSGFSGSLLAVHLLRRLPAGCRVYLIEKRLGFGRGLAYSTGNPSHLLNVRANRMSAFDDDPEHFLRWLATRPGAELEPEGFVPRQIYGAYIQSLLGEQLWGEGSSHGLYLFPDEAEALTQDGDGVTIQMACGRPVTVDAAVLAVGNFPPEAPRGGEALGDSLRYHADPWDEQTLAAIPPTARVLVIGTGLTMVDLVLSLLDRGHQGPLMALSRRGLLPHRHAQASSPVVWGEPLSGLSQMLHRTRRKAEGGDWRAVVDGMRPHLQDWWLSMSLTDQRRFLRHLRPWWDIHRHRLAPPVAERLNAAVESGRLTVLAGHVTGVTKIPGALTISYRPRGGSGDQSLTAAHVVNCSGPSSDYGRISQPLLRQLLDGAVVKPDRLRLGLDVDGELRLINGAGQPNPRLYALGPVTRGRFWEVTAVPEIRRQAQWLAGHLASKAFKGGTEAAG